MTIQDLRAQYVTLLTLTVDGVAASTGTRMSAETFKGLVAPYAHEMADGEEVSASNWTMGAAEFAWALGLCEGSEAPSKSESEYAWKRVRSAL